MTKAQERMVERIRKDAIWMDGLEIKEFAVHENEYFVSVSAVVGHPNDEGTMAEVFCRDRTMVFIGKRGGMEVPTQRKLKNGNYKYYNKPYKSFLGACLDYEGR